MCGFGQIDGVGLLAFAGCQYAGN